MTTLREARVQRLLSIRGLAKQADISPVTLQDLEAGRRLAQPRTIRKLCDALGVEPRDIAEFRRAMDIALEGKVAA